MPTPYTFSDLFAMSSGELHAVMKAGYPLDLDAMVGKQYLGADLSLGKTWQKLTWKTFRKTFVRDDTDGGVRGWNVRMEQRGIFGAQVPMRTKSGEPRTFAHYRVRPADGLTWPKGWHGAHYLDYSGIGNPRSESFAFTPAVAVNEGSSDLVLGWEIFKVGGRLIAPPVFWAIKVEGPVEHLVSAPSMPA